MPAPIRGLSTGHPRVCGENPCPSANRRVRGAGHPRVCGENAPWIFEQRQSLRAIPACAGRTTGAQGLFAQFIGPSPRVRGERRLPPTRPPGSPGHPRVCGENVALHHHLQAVARAIPACAGRTALIRQHRAAGQRAIPACAGRTQGAPSSVAPHFGPSPRVRGERTRHRRSTPAAPGHPRVCGENDAAVCFHRSPAPGHPRVCGENAAGAPAPALALPGHPRVCGENCHAPRTRA